MAKEIEEAEQAKFKKMISTLIEVNQDIKGPKDKENEAIKIAIKEAVNINPQKKNTFVSSKLLQISLFKILSKLKLQDFRLHGESKEEIQDPATGKIIPIGTPRPPAVEKLVNAAVASVMEEGDYANVLIGKNGADIDAMTVGDGFYWVGVNEENAFPYKVERLSYSNVYMDPYANHARDAKEIMAIFTASREEFEEMFEDDFDLSNVENGDIPTNANLYDESNFSQRQRDVQAKRIQWGYYYNLNKETLIFFAGGTCEILDVKQEEDYPHYMGSGNTKKIYHPICQRVCFLSPDGPYNFGFCSLLYDVSKALEKIENKYYKHVSKNTNPLSVLSIPTDSIDSFYASVASAEQERDLGGDAFIPVGYDQNLSNGTGISTRSLTTQSLVNDFNLMKSIFEELIKRIGVPLDEIVHKGNVTARQIDSESEASSAVMAQISENNAEQTKFDVNLCVDMIKTRVKKNNKTPLGLRVSWIKDGEELILPSGTLGALQEELKRNSYKTYVNRRSGVVQSNFARIAALSQFIQSIPAGSQQSSAAIREIANLRGLDFAGEVDQVEKEGVQSLSDPSQIEQGPSARQNLAGLLN